MATLYNKGVAESINAAYFRGESLSGIWHKGEFWPLTNDLIYYGQVLVTDTENELTVEQIASRVTPDYITSKNKYIVSEKASAMPENLIEFMAVDSKDNDNGTYFNYMWFAYPEKFGAVLEVRNEFNAKETAWKTIDTPVVINGKNYTLMVYENALTMSNPMSYLFKTTL